MTQINKNLQDLKKLRKISFSALKDDFAWKCQLKKSRQIYPKIQKFLQFLKIQVDHVAAIWIDTSTRSPLARF